MDWTPIINSAIIILCILGLIAIYLAVKENGRHSLSNAVKKARDGMLKEQCEHINERLEESKVENYNGEVN